MLCFVVWCGVAWFGAVWCGMVRYGAVRCGIKTERGRVGSRRIELDGVRCGGVCWDVMGYGGVGWGLEGLDCDVYGEASPFPQKREGGSHGQTEAVGVSAMVSCVAAA